uniref:G-protein coupled receptors family 1 profile domain-containing protein n=1 Tax=Clastoptera arizonana TaxID=38151 RepID=A0A1B6E7U0_9HEMI
MTTDKARTAVLITWVFSLSCSLLLELSFADLNKPTLNCNVFSITPKAVVVIVSLSGCLPYFVTMILYMLIFKTAMKVKRSKDKIKTKQNLMSGIKTVSKMASLKHRLSNISLTDKIVSEKNNCEDKEIKLHPKYLESFKNVDKNIISDREISMRNINVNLNMLHNKNNKRQKNYMGKSCMILLLVFSSFFISWGPSFAVLLSHLIMCPGCSKTEDCFNLEIVLTFLSVYLGPLNALINPIIYFWFHRGFRNALLVLFCKKKIKRNRQEKFMQSVRTSIS